MFSNCYKYNPPDHDVVGMARKLQVSTAVRSYSQGPYGHGKPGIVLEFYDGLFPGLEKSLKKKKSKIVLKVLEKSWKCCYIRMFIYTV